MERYVRELHVADNPRQDHCAFDLLRSSSLRHDTAHAWAILLIPCDFWSWPWQGGEEHVALVPLFCAAPLVPAQTVDRDAMVHRSTVAQVAQNARRVLLGANIWQLVLLVLIEDVLPLDAFRALFWNGQWLQCGAHCAHHLDLCAHLHE